MVAVDAAVVGTFTPQAVQVVVTGLTVGDAYRVVGVTGDFTWDVRGGAGVADASQVVRTDVGSPVNTPIVYRVEIDGLTVAESDPVTVDYSGDYVLQALNGSVSVAFTWQDNGDPRTFQTRVSAYSIPGRSTPVTAWDVAAGESGELVAVTRASETDTMRAMVRAGAPLLLRTDGNCRDLAPVEFVHVTSAQAVLTGAGIQTTNPRAWSLGFVVISDPEPNTIVAASTWADFDASYAALTWADFDAEWAGSTWADFDREDWATRAES